MFERIRSWLDERPFRRFVVQLSSGRSYVVRHPEMAILTKSQLVVVDPETEDVAVCALLHITALETLRRGANGRKPKKGL